MGISKEGSLVEASNQALDVPCVCLVTGKVVKRERLVSAGL